MDENTRHTQVCSVVDRSSLSSGRRARGSFERRAEEGGLKEGLEVESVGGGGLVLYTIRSS